MSFIHYITRALLNAVLIISTGILPWIGVAAVLNLISSSIQRNMLFPGTRGFIFLTAPGVVVHELSHAAFCLVFRHRIMKMKLFSPEDNGTLGYVQHQYDPHSIYQRTGNFFIGTGPIWGGLFLLYILSRLLLPQDIFSSGRSYYDCPAGFLSFLFSAEAWGSLSFYVWLYASLTISAHITLSPPDIKGARDGGIALVVFIVLACLLFGWCGNWEEYMVQKLIQFFLQFFSLLILIATGLLLIVVILKCIPVKFRISRQR